MAAPRCVELHEPRFVVAADLGVEIALAEVNHFARILIGGLGGNEQRAASDGEQDQESTHEKFIYRGRLDIHILYRILPHVSNTKASLFLCTTWWCRGLVQHLCWIKITPWITLYIRTWRR